MQRPNAAAQMATACMLLIPRGYELNLGVAQKVWESPVKRQFFANLKSYGGTERASNGLTVIEDTLTMTTWYRPDIKAGCRVTILQSGATYEIINEPENWEMRNQFLVCKLRRVAGGG